MKCWDANVEIRPTAKELYQLLRKWKSNKNDEDSEIYSQINEKPVNSSGITSINLISECFDCQLNELDLNDQDD
ncbi:unnamed protein product [Rhizophagus irregularis]|nr:unnamed protein product [Rhizophagus irregularis]CAB5365855.1 unnamed protein product [Rhizophagus irregularis]